MLRSCLMMRGNKWETPEERSSTHKGHRSIVVGVLVSTMPLVGTRLAPIIANDIAAALSTAGASVPVHGPFRHEGA